MNKKDAEDFGFGNASLPERDSLQTGIFSKILKTTSTFFTLEETKLYFPLWTVGAIFIMFTIAFFGIIRAFYESAPPPNLIDFSNRTAVLNRLDSLHCIRLTQDALYQDTSIERTPIAEMILGDTSSAPHEIVGYLYSAEIFNTPYIESQLLSWRNSANAFYADSIYYEDYLDTDWENADWAALAPTAELDEKDWLQEMVKRRKHRTLIDLYKDIPTLKTPVAALEVPALDLTPIDLNIAKRDNLQITLTSGALLSFARYTPDTEFTRLRNAHTSPIFGLHYGVQISKLVRRYSYLFAGFDRQVYYQSIDLAAERAFNAAGKNDAIGWRYAAAEYQNSATITSDTTTIAGMQIRRLAQHNTFHATQFKFGFGHTFKGKKWEWQPAVGFAIGKIHAAAGKTIDEDLNIVEYGVPDDMFQQLQLLSIVGMDAQLELNEQWNLRLGYQYRQQWNNATYEEGLLLRPGFHYLSAGIQLKL